MRVKKMAAITLALALAFGSLTMPEAKMQTKAGSIVYTDNRAWDIPRANIQTPPDAVRLYAGMSRKALEDGIGVRLVVSETMSGPVAKKVLESAAASLGAAEVKTIDMTLEEYIGNSGWTGAIAETSERIRVCIALPKNSDPAKDYAVISLKEDGAYEVLGDLDPDPTTITVDTNYFKTYMIVAAPMGTFNQYKVPSPNAVDKVELPKYLSKVPSAIGAESHVPEVRSLGIITDAETTRAAVGGAGSILILRESQPGKQAVTAMENAVKNTKAVRDKVKDGLKMVDKRLTYYDMELRSQTKGIITQTDRKLRITMTVPDNVPAYADYAIAVLNADGGVSILKDIDIDEGNITFDTDQFRLVVFLWGKKGAFDEIK